jgi:hypothetical protein
VNEKKVPRVRLSDLQARLLSEPKLVSMNYRGRVLSIIDGLVKRQFLTRGAHPHFYTRTDAGLEALRSFLHYGGVPADESRLKSED